MVFLIRGTKIIDPYLHMAIETVETHDIVFLSLIFLVAESSLFNPIEAGGKKILDFILFGLE